MSIFRRYLTQTRGMKTLERVGSLWTKPGFEICVGGGTIVGSICAIDLELNSHHIDPILIPMYAFGGGFAGGIAGTLVWTTLPITIPMSPYIAYKYYKQQQSNK